MKKLPKSPSLLLIAVLTLLNVASFKNDSFARKSAEILYLKHMDGEIELSQKHTSLITKGDIVALKIDADKVIVGDRMFIYQPLGSSNNKTKQGDRLSQVGSLIIRSIIEDRVYAKIDTATREIHSGSRVKFELPRYIQHGRYFKFIKRIIDAKLENPLRERIRIGIIDVTDEHGNITRLTKAIHKNISSHLCKRRQFECVSSNKLTDYLKRYRIATSASVGPFIRKKLAKEFSLNLLVTASSVHDESGVTLTLTAWDLKEDMKTKPYTLKEPITSFTKSKIPLHKILKYKSKTEYGHLRVTVSYNSSIKGKRVDHLFMESIQSHLFKKYKGAFSQDISNDIELGRLAISIRNRFYKPNGDGLLFNDIIKVGKQRMLVSAIPILKGGTGLVVGRPIEKLIMLTIEPNEEVNTNIILTTYVDKAIIIVDSNSTE